MPKIFNVNIVIEVIMNLDGGRLKKVERRRISRRIAPSASRDIPFNFTFILGGIC